MAYVGEILLGMELLTTQGILSSAIIPNNNSNKIGSVYIKFVFNILLCESTLKWIILL